ncbi:hypothetical protein RDV84_00680 [Lysobacter yananisis]|uniref:Transmembrane protein n=1 Tax=Lysobacter yananisis TaxID=1003114 RepID=A0ABY9PB43_9GAMM|nr:hypothetical protein [Lysobacter yananisis]WMT03401.1 hypothetical protein RDV84_00680 [Lysobacter yananisis]
MNDPLPTAAPTPAPNAAPASKDADQLDLIGILYYVLAAFAALFSLFPLLHVGMGIAMLTGAFDQPGNPNPPPPAVGWVFVIFGAGFILCGLAFAALLVLGGRRMRQRRSHTLCAVVAGVSCMFMPLGTILGVFALVLLLKPETKALFGAN